MSEPSSYYCANCGQYHAPGCPDEQPVSEHILTDAGKRIIEQLVAEVTDLRARVAALEVAKPQKRKR